MDARVKPGHDTKSAAAIGWSLDQHAHDVGFLHDQEVLAVELQEKLPDAIGRPPSRLDSRSPADRVHFQTGIIRQRRESRALRRCACFQQRIARKRGLSFFGFGQIQLPGGNGWDILKDLKKDMK